MRLEKTVEEGTGRKKVVAVAVKGLVWSGRGRESTAWVGTRRELQRGGRNARVCSLCTADVAMTAVLDGTTPDKLISRSEAFSTPSALLREGLARV